ncbi:MAG: S1/P1 nuclease [Patescibacteria group bacterium]|nr:S1/P1 nuclease [Patescibacteria group bacterium]
MRPRSLAAAVLALTLGLSAGQPAHAWGKLGHRLTARLAESHVSDRTKAAVAELLDDGEDLATASMWADVHKRQLKGSAPWHYVNVPIDEPRYDARFCPESGCVVSKIAEFRAVLADKSKPREERQKALRFVVHLVGDLHQPLHVGDNGDRGGNDTQVRFFKTGTNMHALWDRLLIENAGKDEVIWLGELVELDTDENRAAWSKGTVEDWATESLKAAKVAYKVPGADRLVERGEKLGGEYFEANIGTVRERLAQGGIRLARVLNEALGNEP